MPDWAQHVRPRLLSLRLSPAREGEIIDELSQHLDDAGIKEISFAASRRTAVSAGDRAALGTRSATAETTPAQ